MTTPASALLTLALFLPPQDAGPAGEELDAARQWGQWRGPLATGEAPHADPPIEWGETRNVRWKLPLPGLGHGSPVVWGERIFLTTAIPFGDALEPLPDLAPGAHDNLPVTHPHRFEVLAVDRREGRVLWQRRVREELPHEGGHVSGSLASASPVTDGELVFAFFGSRGLYALTVDGQPVWSRDLGVIQTKHGHGEGSSPALHGDSLVVNCDHEGQSFVTALDKRTGEERWRVLRDEVTSWATPLMVEHGGRTQVVISGTGRLRGYDLETGEVLWECGGLANNVVASPVAGGGLVFAGSSYEKKAMLAIRLEGAEGDLGETDRVAWLRRRRTPYVPSPLLYGDALYFLNHYQSVLCRVEAQTGTEPTGPFRLPGIENVYASPVGAAGRLYVTDLSGATLVLSAGEEPQALALNQLNDRFSASAALAGRELFLRGERYLYCIAEEEDGLPAGD